jgi:DNA-binding MarR family transcriptional regulator
MDVFKAYPLDHSPGYLINRLATKMNSVLYREFKTAGYNITAQQWAILNRLWEEDGLHQSLLAERTTKNRHNVSRMVTVLEKQQLIKRQPDPDDSRLQRIHLTKKGKKLRHVLVPIAQSTMESMLIGLNQSDLKSLRQILEHMTINLDSSDNQTFT